MGEPKKYDRNELTFLYKKCPKIRPWVISKMGTIPEFMNAVKSYKLDINDESLYEILRIEYKKMLDEGRGYRNARDVMKKVSADVKGDSLAWESE